MVGFPLSSYSHFFGVMRNKLLWTTASETSNTKYLELIEKEQKFKK